MALGLDATKVVYRPRAVFADTKVTVRCTVIAKGEGRNAPLGARSYIRADDSFIVKPLSIAINNATAMFSGEEYEFTATIDNVPEDCEIEYEWTSHPVLGSLKDPINQETVTYVAPDVRNCVFSYVEVTAFLRAPDGTETNVTAREEFMVLPFRLRDWNVVPDNKPIGMRITTPPPLSPDARYEWSATSGSFTGTGEVVTFMHPTVGAETSVTITCKVTLRYGEEDEFTTEGREHLIVVHAAEIPIVCPEEPCPTPPPPETFSPTPPTPSTPPTATVDPTLFDPTPPIPVIRPIPADPGQSIDTVRPEPFVPLPPLPEPTLLVELCPLVPPTMMCLKAPDPIVIDPASLVTPRLTVMGIPKDEDEDGCPNWDELRGYFSASRGYFTKLEASAVGEEDLETSYLSDEAQSGVQLHVVVAAQGNEGRVELGTEYVEGTIIRDVVMKGEAGTGGSLNAKVRDDCEAPVTTPSPPPAEPPPPPEVDPPVDAIAPSLSINNIGTLPENRTVQFTVTPSGGRYDAIDYDWSVVRGGGIIGANALNPANAAYTSPLVDEDTDVVIRCVATARGTGTNADGGTSDTSMAEEAFIVKDMPDPASITAVVNGPSSVAAGTFAQFYVRATGNYDEIAYQWRISSGFAQIDGTGQRVSARPTRAAPTVTIECTVTAKGTGDKARNGTTSRVVASHTFNVT